MTTVAAPTQKTPPSAQPGWRQPVHISAAGNYQVKTAPGGVENLIVGKPGTTLVVKVYDTATYSTATKGTLVATITWSGSVPAVLPLHLWCYSGIALVVSGTSFDVTVTFG